MNDWPAGVFCSRDPAALSLNFGSMEKTCPFCVPEPSRLLVSEGLVLALRDGYPVSRGHSLIVPRRHVGSFREASLEEQSAMLAMLQRVRALLDAELRPDG